MSEEIGGAAAPFAQPAGDPGGMTAEAAQGEYRQLMSSPEFQQQMNSPHGKVAALERLEALAKTAWPSAGQSSEKSPQAVRAGQEAALDAIHGQSAADAGQGEPLTEAEQRQMADAFAPRSPEEFKLSVPDSDQFPHAAEWRQQFFDDRISPSVANLIMNAPGMIENSASMSDDDYFGACDKAAAEVKALPGGPAMLRKAIGMVEALPDGHPYIPIAEALLMRSGGILELSHWSDRLRAKGAAK